MHQLHPRLLVSVIIAAYNEGPLLAEAISSALAQTYPRVEVIVVNDGSPDPITQQTAAHYAGRIVYLEQSNGGVAAARNAGLAAASGELIAWLDQDDRWLPHKLAVEVRALLAHPRAGLVHSSYYLIDAAGRRTGVTRLPEREWQPLPGLLVDIPISPCTVLFRRALLAETGPLEPGLNHADDWYWCLLLAIRGYRFYCISEPLAEYRLHMGNTFRQPDRMLPAWLGMLDRFYARSDLPPVAHRWRGRAYFSRYADATAMYYGAGRLDQARIHLRNAARVYPSGVAGGRFLQSLIYSASTQPTRAAARDAIRFVREGLSADVLPQPLARKLGARAWLVLAVHAAASNPRQAARDAVHALRADPRLLADRELWAAGGRLLARVAGRARRRPPAARSEVA